MGSYQACSIRLFFDAVGSFVKANKFNHIKNREMGEALA
jgi:hypothetical protein